MTESEWLASNDPLRWRVVGRTSNLKQLERVA
jgi:hypothetical protein